MSLKILSTKTFPEREKFENRLKLIAQSTRSIRFKETPNYTKFRLFCSYIIVRCYDKAFSIHFEDQDHWQMKRQYYSEVKYECNDMQFIANILELVKETQKVDFSKK